MLVGWLNSFLFDQQRSKTPFIMDFVEEISFIHYSVEYLEKQAQLQVKLNFEVGEEN